AFQFPDAPDTLNFCESRIRKCLQLLRFPDPCTCPLLESSRDRVLLQHALAGPCGATKNGSGLGLSHSPVQGILATCNMALEGSLVFGGLALSGADVRVGSPSHMKTMGGQATVPRNGQMLLLQIKRIDR